MGNTTKAKTKGIAIGSAVIAAVSLFASFIAVIAVGQRGQDQPDDRRAVLRRVAGMLTVSDPMLFIGMLIGGAVPFLFSSMMIRAVGRAAFLIVKECRIQFRDKEIWAGTKKPDYGRVVDICTSTAQKELIGPGLLAMLAPMLVGFLPGPVRPGRLPGGMIVVGQLLAVFMANAGGAWDNAKKMIEDEPIVRRQGQREAQGRRHRRHRGRSAEGHRRPGHQPADQGHEHGQPAGLGLVLPYNVVAPAAAAGVTAALGIAPSASSSLSVCVAGHRWAVWQSKRETVGIAPRMRSEAEGD